MFKTLPIFLSLIFTLAFLTARGQFAAGDRALNSSLRVDYSRIKNEPIERGDYGRLTVSLAPQFSLFASRHLSIGFGMSLYYERGKSFDPPPVFFAYKNRLDFTPQLYLQYYRPIQGAWYGSTKDRKSVV